MSSKAPWLDIFDSGVVDEERYKAIIDNLSFSFPNETCVKMKPILERSMQELEHAAVHFDRGKESSKVKKQIVVAKDIIVKNGFPEMRYIKIEDEKLIMLEAVVIILLSFHPEVCSYKYIDNNALIARYPEFESTSRSSDLDKLRGFANFMNFTFYFVTAKLNRQHVFNIVTRITEGKDVRYVTGTGKTQSTSDRVLIYNREGGILPKSRPIKTIELLLDDNEIMGPESIMHDGNVVLDMPVSDIFVSHAFAVPSPVTHFNDDSFNTSLGKRQLSMIMNDLDESPRSSIDLDSITPGEDHLGLNYFTSNKNNDRILPYDL